MTIYIGTPILQQQGNGLFRLTTLINDVPLWFESRTRLEVSAEAIVGLMLLPALERHELIVSDQPLSPLWQENIRRLVAQFSAWWGYERGQELLRADESVPMDRVPCGGTGLCFSGGVDSFYSLLHENADITHLIFAHGYDIPLSDQQRFDDSVASFELVAAELGKIPVCVRTNLREHPVFASVSWEKTHGAALAALGHLLSGQFGQLRIASSFANEESTIPWGSSPVTDSLWSSSDMNIEHGDVNLTRMEKLARIADDLNVQRHLRVCWQNRNSELNCSRCEKCLRTMIALQVLGKLPDFSCFEKGVNMSYAIRNVRLVGPGFIREWSASAILAADTDQRKAIESLVHRSSPRFSGKLRRFIHRRRVAAAN